MNKETKDALKAKISDLNSQIDEAQSEEQSARTDKDKYVAIWQTCKTKLDDLRTQKQKIQEDIPPTTAVTGEANING